jgi:nitrogen-specific signal transduction histidine kinase/ActR/RegA family two-component response regulator
MKAPEICDKGTVNGGGPHAAQAAPPETLARCRLDERYLRTQRLESIGMLASGIAHDLNNVLSPIILAAPVLREHATNPEDVKMILSVEKSAERGVELVRQILSFAHGADSVQQVLQINHLIQETLVVAKETFPKSIVIEDDVPGELWPINADPTQIHQVLLNLCVNARDAMPAGGRLRLSAENRILNEKAASRLENGRPGAYVVVSVEDTGTGITSGVLSQMWEPFFTTKGEGKGTGIGLSTVRSIVEGHNGLVAVHTLLGQGSTFTVYLPAAEAAASAAGPGETESKAAQGNGELVLVVDDEPHIREMASSMLTRSGYRVLTACDGADAVAILASRANEIKVVVTDLVMPNLDGAALASIAQHLNPSVKLLAISGLSSAGRKGKAERFGSAFLFKPFKVQALLAAVHGLLHPEPVAEAV